MTAFDPTTAYLSDWQYHDFIESADYEPPATGELVDRVFGLKVKRLDASDTGYEAVALSLGLNAEDTVLIVWMPLNDDGEIQTFEPEANGKVILADSEETWMVDRFRKSRFGHWEMSVTKARENAEP